MYTVRIMYAVCQHTQNIVNHSNGEIQDYDSSVTTSTFHRFTLISAACYRYCPACHSTYPVQFDGVGAQMILRVDQILFTAYSNNAPIPNKLVYLLIP